MRLSLGLPGLARSTHSSSGSDVKREDKEDDDNSSVGDKSDDEKKDAKAAHLRRYAGPSSGFPALVLWICVFNQILYKTALKYNGMRKKLCAI